MPKSAPNPNVDAYLVRATKWVEEFTTLRSIVLDCGLSEELKWGEPCYTFKGKNVVIIHGFKEYCALLFVKGALLRDPKGILIRQTENVQAARQVRFENVREIVKLRTTLKAYVNEAVEAEKAGLKVEMKKTSEFNMPEEFRRELDRHPALKESFQALTPGRQHGYLLYFAAAKQAKTREARIEKYREHILSGKGLND